MTFVFCSLNSFAGDEVVGEEKLFIVDGMASYSDEALLSLGGTDVCGLNRSVPSAIEKMASKYKIKVSLQEKNPSIALVSKNIALEIVRIEASRGAMHGVASDLDVVVTVNLDQGEPVKKLFKASASRSSYFTHSVSTCERLEQCSDKIGAQVAKWLRNSER